MDYQALDTLHSAPVAVAKDTEKLTAQELEFLGDMAISLIKLMAIQE